MHYFSAMFTYFALLMNVGQEYNIIMILKAFVALKFAVVIDDMFVTVLPSDFKTNAK